VHFPIDLVLSLFPFFCIICCRQQLSRSFLVNGTYAGRIGQYAMVGACLNRSRSLRDLTNCLHQKEGSPTLGIIVAFTNQRQVFCFRYITKKKTRFAVTTLIPPSVRSTSTSTSTSIKKHAKAKAKKR
jgi:hypothetical protein